MIAGVEEIKLLGAGLLFTSFTASSPSLISISLRLDSSNISINFFTLRISINPPLVDNFLLLEKPLNNFAFQILKPLLKQCLKNMTFL